MIGLAVFAFAYVLSQFYRSFLAVLAPTLSADVGVDAAMLSLASGAWFVGFALAQLPVGVWLDRHGPRRTAGVLLGGAGAGGALLFANAQSGLALIIAMALIGIGCAPVLVASFYICARRFSAAKFATLSSFLIGVGTAGNVIGAAPLAAAAEAFGWRTVMLGIAVVTLLTAAGILALARDPEPVEHRAQGPDRGILDVLHLLKMPVLWPIFALMAINYAPTAGVRGFWAGPYLADVLGLEGADIGRATLWMALAMIAGNFFYGPLDQLLGTRKWVCFAGGVAVTGFCAALAIAPAASPFHATAMLIGIGFFGVSYVVIMAHGRAFVPPHLLGRGVALLNFFSIGGVGAMQLMTGAVFNTFADPARPEVGYSALFWFYALCMGLATLVYLFARDARP